MGCRTLFLRAAGGQAPLGSLTEGGTPAEEKGASRIPLVQGACTRLLPTPVIQYSLFDGFNMKRKQGNTESSDMRMFYESKNPDGRPVNV